MKDTRNPNVYLWLVILALATLPIIGIAIDSPWPGRVALGLFAAGYVGLGLWSQSQP